MPLFMNLRAPLANPVFRRVWIGQFVNVVGDGIFVVALAAFIIGGRDEPVTALSTVLAVVAAGGVASVLFGGLLADRKQRSGLIIASDVLRGTGVAIIALAGADASLFVLICGGLLVGFGTGLYRPAYQALLPSLVSEEQLEGANALRGIANRFAGIAGAAVAGLLVAGAGAGVALWVNVATFVFSILTLLRVGDHTPIPESAEGSAPLGGVLADAREGFAYVARRRWVLAIMAQGAVQIAFVTAPLGVLLPLALRHSEGAYAWAVGVQAFGAVIGAATASHRRYKYPGLLSLACVGLEALLPMTIAMHLPVPIILIASFLAGAGLAFFAVLWTTALQKQVPNGMRGRVFALDALAATSFAPFGALIGGLSVGILGLTGAGWIAAAVLLLSVIACVPIAGVATFSDPVPDDGNSNGGRRDAYAQ